MIIDTRKAAYYNRFSRDGPDKLGLPEISKPNFAKWLFIFRQFRRRLLRDDRLFL